MSDKVKQLCRNGALQPKIFEIAKRDVAVGLNCMVRGLQYCADTCTFGYYLQSIVFGRRVDILFSPKPFYKESISLNDNFSILQNFYFGNCEQAAVNLY